MDKNKKILIVDDEEVFHQLVRFSFPEYEFESVYDIETAKQVIEKDDFDLILLDLEYDNEVLGFDFISYAKDWVNTPVIVVTNENDRKNVLESGKQGAADFLYKRELDPKVWKELFLNVIEKSKLYEELQEDKNKKNISNLEMIAGSGLNKNAIEALIQLASIYEQQNNLAKAEEKRLQAFKLRKQYALLENTKNVIKINEVQLNNTAFFKEIDWQLQTQVNVLLGQNAYGKSYLLKLLAAIFLAEREKLDVLLEHYKDKETEYQCAIKVTRGDNPHQIICKRNEFDLSFGQIPILAIADNRNINRNLGIPAKGEEQLLELATNGGSHILENEEKESTRIVWFLGRLADYFDENSEHPILIFLKDIMNTLFTDGLANKNEIFDFHDIDPKGKVYVFKLRTISHPDEEIEIQKLSRGTLSILAIFGLIFEYLSQLAKKRGVDDLDKTKEQAGIVLIDEVDAHLHPIWQKKIVHLLKQHFPNVQFILTAHSPLVVAGALENEVSVLRRFEGNFKLVQVKKSFLGVPIEDLYKSVFELEEDYWKKEMMEYFNGLTGDQKEVLNKDWKDFIAARPDLGRIHRKSLYEIKRLYHKFRKTEARK